MLSSDSIDYLSPDREKTDEEVQRLAELRREALKDPGVADYLYWHLHSSRSYPDGIDPRVIHISEGSAVSSTVHLVTRRTDDCLVNPAAYSVPNASRDGSM